MHRASPPLDGLLVVDLGPGIPTATCARLLAGYGATVVHVGTGRHDLSDDEAVFYRSGISILDAASLGEPEVVDLVQRADVVLDGHTPGALAAWGLDLTELRRHRPDMIVTSVTPFGQDGPHVDWVTTNAVQFAVGGIMSLTGEPSRPPLVTGGDQAFVLGGLHAFAATTAAIFGRSRAGRGDHLDLSMQECAASMPELYGAMSEYETGEPVVRAANSVRATWGVYPCADGWAGVCCLERQVPALFGLIGDPVVDDPRFLDPLVRRDHDDELLAYVMGFMLDHTKDELLELSPRHRVPFGAVRTPLELLDDESFRERSFFDTVHVDADSRETAAVMPGRPFPGLPWLAPDERVDHRDGGVRYLDPDRRDVPVDPPARGAAQRPLEGLRVLDLTMMWAGPYATKLMAELGAEVIKVESPSAWDNIRTLIPQEPEPPDPWNSSYYFNEYNHSKKSLTLDLATETGRDLLLRLVPTADIVIENYRADVLDKLGLGYDTLRSANPEIVVISMGGFGKTGALRSHVGFGPIIEMMSGLMSLTGYEGDDVPYKTGVSYGDPVGGLHAFAAASLALLHRDRTGTGVHIDLAQTETAASMAGPAFVAASMRGETPTPHGNRSERFVPQGCYPSNGDDQWLVISVPGDTEWAAFCEVMLRPDLAPLTVDQRQDRHDELDEVIAGWAGNLDAHEASGRLQELRIPAGPVLDTRAIHDDPHLVARGFYVEVPNPKMQPYRQTGPTWRFTDAPNHEMVRSPWFGEHNAELLDEIGIDEETRAGLAERNVIGDAPINPGVG